MQGLMKTRAGPGNVELAEVPEPRPGPGQVKIKVMAAGICGSDLHILHDDIKLNLRPPVIMGHEFSGIIAEVGEGVQDWKPGDRVSSETAFSVCGECLCCRTGNYNLCDKKYLIGYVYDGCFTDYVVVPQHRLHRLPERLSWSEGAVCEPLACCVHGALELAHVGPQEVVVVAGPGAIGQLTMQVARAAGATVIVTGAAGDEERLATARELGANVTVQIQQKSMEDIVLELTQGRGADAYLECSGAPAAARAGLAITRKGGRYLQMGLSSGAFPIEFSLIAYRELEVTGSIGSKWTSWVTALKLLDSGAVDVAPLVKTVYSLPQWQQAFEAFENRSAFKVLFLPESP
ncbi:MAG: zinc-binding dehydrogenase [Chloroflexi bacterium]|nr:zinc-binding dehydrogenase [Chloroflexota bacterium]